MIKEFKNLSVDEQKLLIKAPALVSVLAASGDHEINKSQKADAMKMSHLKTFTADPALKPYYDEVEKSFKSNFEAIVNAYAPFDDLKREELKSEINRVNEIIAKLDWHYSNILHKSLTGYAEHVKKAEKSVIESFIFPIPIRGLTD